MPDPILAAEAVTAGYVPDLPILKNVSLAARAGQITLIIGPNGAGKSTLIKAVAGLVHINSGRIRVAGREITGQSADRLASNGIAYVPQNNNIFRSLTIEQNLTLAARRAPAQTGVPLESLYAQFPALADKRRDKAGTLSGGQRQFLAIAMALAAAPRLILMDEPFAALDEITRFKLNADLLRVWQASQLTVVFVTHSVFESVFLSERIAVMRASPGRISDEILIDPARIRDERFRTSSDYAALCRQVSDALHAAMIEDGVHA